MKLDDHSIKDVNGNAINLFSIVRVLSIPDFYYTSAIVDGFDIALLEKYIGSFGIVRYNDNSKQNINKTWLGESSLFMVDAIRLEGKKLSVFDFTMTCLNVEVQILSFDLLYLLNPFSVEIVDVVNNGNFKNDFEKYYYNCVYDNFIGLIKEKQK